jgi:hypothetical protein
MLAASSGRESPASMMTEKHVLPQRPSSVGSNFYFFSLSCHRDIKHTTVKGSARENKGSSAGCRAPPTSW